MSQFYIDSANPHLGGYIVGGDDATYYPHLWDWLVSARGVKSVVDVGCGEGHAARYFADHRMEGLARYAGWDLPALGTLGFMTWVRRMEIDFIRPLTADQDVSITSFVREFRGPDAMIECTMTDAAGTTLASRGAS